MARETEGEFIRAVRRPCQYPGCNRLLSKYNDTDNDWCYGHTAREITIEAKKPHAVLRCKPVLPVLPVKKKIITPEAFGRMPIHHRILAAVCYHFETNLFVLKSKGRDPDLLRYRIIALYLLRVHTQLGARTAVHLLDRKHGKTLIGAVSIVEANPQAFATDLLAIRWYCNLLDEDQPLKEAAE